jgi:hypothetical protein
MDLEWVGVVESARLLIIGVGPQPNPVLIATPSMLVIYMYFCGEPRALLGHPAADTHVLFGTPSCVNFISTHRHPEIYFLPLSSANSKSACCQDEKLSGALVRAGSDAPDMRCAPCTGNGQK